MVYLALMSRRMRHASPRLSRLGDLSISPLSRRRLERGLTQRSLAKTLGVTESAVSLWEAGQCAPSPPYRRPLAQALGLSQLNLRELVLESAAWHTDRSELRRERKKLGIALGGDRGNRVLPLAARGPAPEHPATEDLAAIDPGTVVPGVDGEIGRTESGLGGAA